MKLSKTNQVIKHYFSEGYYADQRGYFYNPSDKKMSAHMDSKNLYLWVSLRLPGDRTVRKVHLHKLIAYQKYGDSMFESGINVRHLNGDKLDNTWENIAIGTHQDNMLDICPEDRKKKAVNGILALKSFTKERLAEFWEDRLRGMGLRGLSRKYGVAVSTASYIVNRRTYADWTAEILGE